jgi:hypothetical protein
VVVDEELDVDALGLPTAGFGARFRRTLGGRTYLQLSPRVRHKEQSFS